MGPEPRRIRMTMVDVLVLGNGPAGLAAAAALVEQGLDVAVLAPSRAIHWPAEYGAWADDLETLGGANLAQHRWPRAVVGLGDGDRRVLDRAYVRVDKQRLASDLADRCERGGVRWEEGRAVGVRHAAAFSSVDRSGGGEMRARVVVDASGHRPALVRRAASPAQGFQTAFGFVIEYDGPLFPAGQVVLMDWDDAWLLPAERAASPPSFLYAMPLGDGRLFVEETVLVGRPAVNFAVLERRLRRRLAALGVPVRSPSDEERCWIPMGGALPDLNQRVVGFGGAAGMVHPATGYMLGRVLERAPALASTLARELGAQSADPARATRAAWLSLWPSDRRQRRGLFCFGMEMLLRLDPPRTRAFFTEFFHLSDADWQGYLDDRLSAAELQNAMMRLFRRLPTRLRGSLIGTALGRPGIDLARSVIQRLTA
jgi:lycopene cyclase-like protein